MSNDLVPVIKAAIDGGAFVGILATIVGYLPAVAAVLGIIWYVIQIAESKSGQRVIKWLTEKPNKKRSTLQLPPSHPDAGPGPLVPPNP